MDRLLDRLWLLVTGTEAVSLETRLFRLICLSCCVLSLVVVLPVNLFQNLPVLVNVLTAALGVVAACFFWLSWRGRDYIKTFLLVLMPLLDPAWFQNGGSEGSVTFYFFPAMLFPLVLCHGHARWVLSALWVANLVVLLLLDHFVPSLTVPFQNPTDRLLDLTTNAVVSALCLALLILIILSNYKREHQRLSQAARDLAVSEENYREVVENAQCIILRVDAGGRIRFFNRFAENLYGYARAEVIGRPLLDTLVPAASTKGEDLAGVVGSVLERPGDFPLIEIENICRDGRRIRVTWANEPVCDEHGRLQEILCVGSDITERAGLIEKLQLTQTTMDAAAEQIIWLDCSGRILYANALALEVNGCPAEKFRQNRLSDLFPDVSEAAWEDYCQTLKRDRAVRFEASQRHPSGDRRPVELSLTYINVAGAEYAAAFIHDLTGRKQAEEKRRRHEQQMLHIQKLESVGLLAGGIAHDFNNLLTVVLGNISMARMNQPAGGEDQELLEEAEHATLRARELTAQLLTFSKGGKPVKGVIELEQVIASSVSLALRGGSARCSVRLRPGLWPVEADAAQLGQVFNNLLINAQQAMPGGGQITIDGRNIEAAELAEPLLAPGRHVEITVRDHGVGIPAEALSRIFDPYFTTRQTGSGLGLAVVHSIIKNHGGIIRVDSRPGGGTTFIVLLPAAAASSRVEVAPAPKSSARRRILIMDDEDMVRNVLTRMLTRLGYEVESVPDGAQAVELFRQAHHDARKFDLVIMDLTIPGGMGGRETILQLQKIDADVKALVSSGYSDNPVMSDYRTHGFAGVVAKPYTAEQLKISLKSIFSE
jgi:PAS domain S-box-containing protein